MLPNCSGSSNTLQQRMKLMSASFLHEDAQKFHSNYSWRHETLVFLRSKLKLSELVLICQKFFKLVYKAPIFVRFDYLPGRISLL